MQKNIQKSEPTAGRPRPILFILITVMLIFTMTGAICISALAIYVDNNVDVNFDLSFQNIKLNYTSILYYTDHNGKTQELQKLYGSQNRIWVDYKDIPESLKQAIVAIEDERFWSHKGVDWKRTFGAFLNLVFRMDSSYGGSTITQQLIKNITEYKDVSIQRKVTEIMRALKLEQQLSKEQILELYLNTIPLGEGCYGVQAAAKTYFGKDVSQLSLAECASLAGITNLPYYYDPLTYPDKNKKRQETILWKMKDLGVIDKKAYESAKAAKLVFAKGTTYKDTSTDTTQVNSYFVDQVIQDVIDDLVAEKGYSAKIASSLVYSGGLKIYTTVDPFVQKTMESVYEDDSNFVTLSGTVQPQSAMIVMSTTGDVLGIVGGRGKKTANRVLDRATQSKRQPGSSIKPLTIYSPAIEYGLITPYSVFDDSPSMYISSSGQLLEDNTPAQGKKAWPDNYYTPYRGLITVMEAVQDSANTVPVRVLKELTPQVSFDYASTKLGLKSLVKKRVVGSRTYSDVGYSPLALGALTDGVTLLEMVSSYVPFVNDGIYTEPRTYTKVLDHDGNVLLNNVPSIEVAMSTRTVYYMNTLLQNVVNKGTGARAKIAGIATAGKTGTTESNKDRWFMGYTPYYVGGVWYGYDTPKTITGVGANPALVAWKKVMDILHKNLPNASFKTPDNLVKATYCLDSGCVPTALCKTDIRGNRTAVGTFFPEDVPTTPCKVHQAIQYDFATKMIAGPNCPAANIKTFSMLNIVRYYEVPGVLIKDEQYTIRKFGASLLPSPPAGITYYYAKPVVVSGKKAVNTICTTHNSK